MRAFVNFSMPPSPLVVPDSSENTTLDSLSDDVQDESDSDDEITL
jgi:hypothetical protein